MKSFSEKLSQIAKKQMKEVDSNISQMSRELFHTIVDKTPVGQEGIDPTRGTLVNNWQPAINSISLQYQQRRGPNKTGAHKRIDTTVVNGSFLKDGYVSFSNSTPHAYLAEVTGWPAPRWSGTVGPYEMMWKSILDILTKYKYK